jgi:hypothetical protein
LDRGTLSAPRQGSDCSWENEEEDGRAQRLHPITVASGENVSTASSLLRRFKRAAFVIDNVSIMPTPAAK